MRRVFVGDIQGCRGLLDALLARVGFRPGLDRLHPCGDLVAKGPDSLGVLRRCVEVDAEAVLGNHDLAWLDAGRIEDPHLAAWLARQPLLRAFADCGVVMVHGGLGPHWGRSELERLTKPGAGVDPALGDARWYVTTLRHCTRDGVRPADDWPTPGPPFARWDDWLAGGDVPVAAAVRALVDGVEPRVVFGHWARRGADLSGAAWALDSGACYGGRLTAVVMERGRADRATIVQVG